MWQEVYYERYDVTRREYYREFVKKSMPYSIKCKSGRTKDFLVKLLKSDGLKYVEGSQCLGLLVNLELKRFCSYPKPCEMPHSSKYTEERFLLEVYFPWRYDYGDGVMPDWAVAHEVACYRSFLKASFEPEPGMTEEELHEELIVFI